MYLIRESLAQNFTSDIDTFFLSEEDNKLYLLKGDQYVRLTFYVGQDATMDSGYPQPISNWVDPPRFLGSYIGLHLYAYRTFIFSYSHNT